MGGGGKTSAVIHLARELSGSGWRVLATTTTRVGGSMSDSLPTALKSEAGWRASIVAALGGRGCGFLAAARDPLGKHAGLAPEEVETLVEELELDAVLVEADGAKQRPIKLPASHEPVIPRGTSIVVPMAGLDALGRAVDAETVHRVELAAPLRAEDVVTPEFIGRLLGSEIGGRKGVPPGAVVTPLLNKSDLVSEERLLSDIAERVAVAGGFDAVAVSDLIGGRFARLETAIT